MNINYLILVHANYLHLELLLTALDDKNVHFYVHIDKKASEFFSSERSNVTILQKRTSIFWGGYGMIEATLDLIRRARKDNNGGYYILLSGADYPIRSKEALQKTLSSKKEFINILPGPLETKPIERFEYHHYKIDRRNPRGLKYLVGRLLEKAQKRLKLKRKIPFKIFVGSQWFALTETCIDYILKTLDDDPSYQKFFKYVYIPDEALFQTIIGNSEFYKNTTGNLTYVDWDANPGPAMIGEKHLELFKGQKIFETKYGTNEPIFARKFNDKSKTLVDKIDESLRDYEK